MKRINEKLTNENEKKRKVIKKYRDMNMGIEKRGRERNRKWGWEIGGFAVYDCLFTKLCSIIWGPHDRVKMAKTALFFKTRVLLEIGLEML